MPAFDPSAPLQRLTLTVAEADALLFPGGMTSTRRCRLIRRGEYPMPFKIGGQLVVAAADLRDIIERKRAGAVNEFEQRRQQTAAARAARTAARVARGARGEPDPALVAMSRG